MGTAVSTRRDVKIMVDKHQTPRAGLERYRSYLLLLARSHLNAGYQRRVDASDVVQQTLMEAHEHRAQCRGKTDAEIAGWLRQTLVHNVADAIRALGRAKRDIRRERSLEQRIDDSFANSHSWLVADQSSPSEHVAKGEMVLRLADAVTALPSDQQNAVILHHLQGKTLREIGECLGRSESAVAGLLHRGLKRLRSSMAENGGE